jgi:hypothetical protein
MKIHPSDTSYSKGLSQLSDVEDYEVGLDLENTSFIMKTLYKGLYSDLPLAILRELISNAYDANVMAGYPTSQEPKQDEALRKVSIVMPQDPEHPALEVRDCGLGITPHQMATVVSKVGSSDKRDRDDLVGGFGIGYKAIWNYTDSFSISTVYQNEQGLKIKDLYLGRLNGETPVLSRVHREEVSTTEPTGTTFQVPIQTKWSSKHIQDEEKLGDQCSKFEAALQKLSRAWLLNQPTFYNAAGTDISSQVYEFLGLNSDSPECSVVSYKVSHGRFVLKGRKSKGYYNANIVGIQVGTNWYECPNFSGSGRTYSFYKEMVSQVDLKGLDTDLVCQYAAQLAPWLVGFYGRSLKQVVIQLDVSALPPEVSNALVITTNRESLQQSEALNDLVSLFILELAVEILKLVFVPPDYFIDRLGDEDSLYDVYVKYYSYLIPKLRELGTVGINIPRACKRPFFQCWRPQSSAVPIYADALAELSPKSYLVKKEGCYSYTKKATTPESEGSRFYRMNLITSKEQLSELVLRTQVGYLLDRITSGSDPDMPLLLKTCFILNDVPRPPHLSVVAHKLDTFSLEERKSVAQRLIAQGMDPKELYTDLEVTTFGQEFNGWPSISCILEPVESISEQKRTKANIQQALVREGKGWLLLLPHLWLSDLNIQPLPARRNNSKVMTLKTFIPNIQPGHESLDKQNIIAQSYQIEDSLLYLFNGEVHGTTSSKRKGEPRNRELMQVDPLSVGILQKIFPAAPPVVSCSMAQASKLPNARHLCTALPELIQLKQEADGLDSDYANRVLTGLQVVSYLWGYNQYHSLTIERVSLDDDTVLSYSSKEQTNSKKVLSSCIPYGLKIENYSFKSRYARETMSAFMEAEKFLVWYFKAFRDERKSAARLNSESIILMLLLRETFFDGQNNVLLKLKFCPSNYSRNSLALLDRQKPLFKKLFSQTDIELKEYALQYLGGQLCSLE